MDDKFDTSNHTPGPWNALIGDKILVTARREDHLICNVQLFKNDNETCIANAQLIAAAPDLLKALEACVEYIEMLQEATKSINTACKHQDFLVGSKDWDIDMYEVLEKARGEK